MLSGPFNWPAFVHCPPPPIMLFPAITEDNDVFIKNTTVNPPGNVGPPGPPGPQGPAGSPGLTPSIKPATAETLGAIKVGKCLDITEDGTLSVACCDCDKNTRLVKSDYTINALDWYIGAQPKGSITIDLIEALPDGFELIVKVELGPPIGNKKVIVKAAGSQLIDGNTSVVLQQPYESITLIYRGGNWHKV